MNSPKKSARQEITTCLPIEPQRYQLPFTQPGKCWFSLPSRCPYLIFCGASFAE
ncbi:hypothetical protein FJTKL_00438, partial [Diaporthe vaccinii]